MIRTTSALSLAASVLTFTLVPIASVPAAEAVDSECISKREYRAIARGMSLPVVRQIVGHRGRITSTADFSDGDAWRTVEFRQCGRSWGRSSVSIDFEMSEGEVWVEDLYCDETGCEDYGYYETQYTKPFVVTSKYAYWG